MIKLDSYSRKFEELYLEMVERKIPANIQDYIVNSSEKYLPSDFWARSGSRFRELILAPFEKLNKARQYIKNPSILQIMKGECYISTPTGDRLRSSYQELVDAYKKVADSEEDGRSMRVRIVMNSGLTVCPYCNRDYINYRAKNISGAQLDHFFSKKKYPFFAVSLYNFIPVCGNCNRVKSNQNVEFASPFDETIDWEKDITFHYESDSGNKAKIVIKSEKKAVQNNIKKMRIEEAYQIHDAEVEELLEKKQIYCQTQRQEFRKVLHEIEVSEAADKAGGIWPKDYEGNNKNKTAG